MYLVSLIILKSSLIYYWLDFEFPMDFAGLGLGSNKKIGRFFFLSAKNPMNMKTQSV
jgi:hypothetical protein